MLGNNDKTEDDDDDDVGVDSVLEIMPKGVTPHINIFFIDTHLFVQKKAKNIKKGSKFLHVQKV